MSCARSLTLEQSWTRPPRGTWHRIDELTRSAGASITADYQTLCADSRAGIPVSPAAEWLLDNSYLIDEQVRHITEEYPRNYGHELPRLLAGPFSDWPRLIEAIAALVAHTDSHLEIGTIEHFLAGYQETRPLTIGEAWSVPALLRVVLVENLRRLSSRVLATHRATVSADLIADRLIVAADTSAADVTAQTANLPADPSAPFIVRLSQRMAAQDLALTPVNDWLNAILARRRKSLEQIMTEAQQQQAADQVSVANAITSIRMIEASDWRAFFERVSVVEQTLRADPAGVYARMDFASRDRYRHAVEGLAKHSSLGEAAVAEAAIQEAQTSLTRHPADTARAHVGFYLVSTGRTTLERSIHYRPTPREWLRRGPLAARTVIYWLPLAVLTVSIAALIGWYADAHTAARWIPLITFVIALIPASEIATVIVRRLAAWVWPPRVLPRLDPLLPVSPAHRTQVVYTALLGSTDAALHVIQTMEIGYLGTSDPNIQFAVLADLPAASAQHVRSDEAILHTARTAVERLNNRYGTSGERPFSLFVRQRSFSTPDAVWIGRERKRGALEDLVAVMRGAGPDAFTVFLTDQKRLSGTTFVITLDADTVLPRDSARKLVAAIAHPLNRAVLDPERRTIRHGYGLVQPRVTMSLGSAEATVFARLHSGISGIDPYAGAVSDTYQDVFGEGSFTGKGIFDVDAYATVLSKRLPENMLLSHDLIEGSYLRTALASDIEVLDDQPGNYLAHCARLHRWTRGDWQTLPWLLSRVPSVTGSERTPLLPIHRFKIADNLRRSLLPLATTILVVWGFATLSTGMWGWLALMAAFPLFPVIMGRLDTAFFSQKASGTRGDRSLSFADIRRDLLRAFLDAATLPHAAQLSLDAGIRATWRLVFSHRQMLAWETAAESGKRLDRARREAFVSHVMPAAAVAIGAVLACLLVRNNPAAYSAAALCAIVWLTAPWLTWSLSQPIVPRKPDLTNDDRMAIRRLARITWRFFEHFVTSEDHFLAPDNYQEDPKGEVAHRTSPTNIGLQLLAGVTAHDLGFITTAKLIERTCRTLVTLTGMERFRGHFYNWYDTRTLQPLRPAYISTVDSGNLAGHLLVLQRALLAIPEQPLLNPALLDGIADTARLALEDVRALRCDTTHRNTPDPASKSVAPAAQSAVPALKTAGVPAADLATTLDEIVRHAKLQPQPASLWEWVQILERLEALANPLVRRAASLVTTGGPALSLARVHASIDDLIAAIRAPLDLIATCTPWVLEVNGQIVRAAPLPGIPSLAQIATATEVPGATRARALLDELNRCCELARQLWKQMDFSPLFDTSRMLFSIGFNTAEGRQDSSYYDLLASECRLASFLAIARGDIPQEHWFRLGRQTARTDAGAALVSWSASMFEYLMPLLIMQTWPNTLLDHTCTNVVRRQIQYGQQRDVPWGVSESAFNAKDADLTYQYQAFGVPGLGLKRNLSADLVVAPYATALALMIAPHEALDNLAALAAHGAEGRYGFYEALDYTPGRVPAGHKRAIVKAYMAHHQGMSLVALGNVLTDFRMQQRFHALPLVASTELLLQERVPRRIQVTQPRAEEVEFVRSLREPPQPQTRSYPSADTAVPATHFLSNSRYSVMITNAGGGYSRWLDRSVTRYREDITRDCWGQFIYVRDAETSVTWSSGFQPTGTATAEYHVIFSPDKADFRRLDHEIETHTEVIVSPEDDVEVRRVTLTNHRDRIFSFEITSYFEITLAPRGADHAHKAFSNLFVETEPLPEMRAIVFTRRPRSATEQRVWGMHLLACGSHEECPCSFETSRPVFLGRLRTPANALAMESAGALGNTSGAVLDPICAIRTRFDLVPGESVHLAFVTGCAGSREEIVHLATKYHDIANAQRAADLAWSTSQIELRDLGITPEESVTMLRLASRLLLTDPHSRLKFHTRFENHLPISALWSLGISGDNPILLVKIERLEETPLVRQVLLAHQYWRTKGFVCDLVILNTKPSAYASELSGRLATLMRTGHALQLADRPGGVHLRTADHIPPDVLTCLESVARAVLTGDGGPIEIQLNRRAHYPELPPALIPIREESLLPPAHLERPPLAFFNGYGGFDFESGEYVIALEGGQTTPAPWVNVIARPHCGTLVSEAGIGCTWCENSHENRITTWNNDPVSDGTGECFYIRDEESGEFWSPVLLPIPDEGTYIIRHGHGYSRFEHTTHGIAHTLDCFVAETEPVRIARLRITNQGTRPRRLSITHFIEWVLGDARSAAQQRVVTWWDSAEELLMAHNWFNLDFPGHPAFLACGEITGDEAHNRAAASEADRPDTLSYTASRTEFLGRNGIPNAPAAMRRNHLGGQTGRFHDNCGALMRKVTLEPGASADVTFLLGQAESVAAAHAIVRRLRQPGAADAELAAVRTSWSHDLKTIEVSTPDPALDALLNGSALYQALSCRIWGRTATYQSSGAFGFRDQLQDCLALLESRPDVVRDHIIEASRRQFPEGDVLHWWHPVSGRGVRTRFADDRHWLPLIVAEYIRTTGDLSLLAEETPYLEGPAVPENREDFYLQPHPSHRVASVYEHCLAALDLVPIGMHGLPLMNGGDWNDGMNRVGSGGKGESVWLAWFLDVVFRAFADVCERVADAGQNGGAPYAFSSDTATLDQGPRTRAVSLRRRAATLIAAIERSSWDGAWYRRAFFDDGTPLGTADASECRIDAIAQSWAVISGAGNPERALTAMISLTEQLVDEDAGLIRLLTPPFDRMEHDPGYIKGYVPGVRENGGQYTHAAVWAALAFARLGNGARALALLDLINPVNHTLGASAATRYAAEPYAIAADVYSVEPHVGRGGWTWYTGAASWYYRVAVRDILGIRTEAAWSNTASSRVLVIEPCVPPEWPRYSAIYRFGSAVYHISVENPDAVSRGIAQLVLDDRTLVSSPPNRTPADVKHSAQRTAIRIPLIDDGTTHQVSIVLG